MDETFSMLLALCAGNSPITGEFPWIPLTKASDADRFFKSISWMEVILINVLMKVAPKHPINNKSELL